MRKLFVVAMILLLSGCGGGGSNPDNGGGSGTPSEEPENPTFQPMAITRIGATTILESSLGFITLTQSMMFEAPFLAFAIHDQEGEGDFYEEFDCDNLNGKYTISGSFSEDSGEIIASFQSCEDSTLEVKTDGVMRIIISQADSIFIPTNYTVSLESFKNSSTTSDYQDMTEGTIEVMPVTVDTQVASTNIRITNLNTEVYIETDDLRIYGDTPVGLSPSWEQTRITGGIIYSNLGTLQLSSGTSLMDYLKIKGLNNSGIHLRFLDEEYFIATLDENGDGSWEAYLHDSLSSLTRSYEFNHPPIAVIDDTVKADPGSPVVISLLGVTDPDCDFLDYSIDLLESPPGSEFEWTIDNDLNLIVYSDEAGTYAFNLIINDHKNGILEKRINLNMHIDLDPPVVDPTQTSYLCNIGDLVEVDMSPSNPEVGPFTYEISPVLPGMEIGSDGIFAWQISDQGYYFPNTTVEVTVFVSNIDNEVGIPLSFKISDPEKRHPIVRTGIEVPAKERNTHVGDFDNDGITEVLLTDNKNLIYTLEWNGAEYIQDWVYPYEINSPENSIDTILPFDLNGDGRYKIFIQTGLQIKVLDRTDNTITESVDLSQFLPQGYINPGRGMAITDLNGDGEVELVALFNTDYYVEDKLFVLNAIDLNPLWQTLEMNFGKSMEIGNVDGDSTPEIVLSGGYVIDGLTGEVEWKYSDAFGTEITLADIDGNGISEIVAATGAAAPVVYDAVMKTAVLEFPDEGGYPSIVAANLDGDPQKEIIVGNCPYGYVTAYDVDSSSAVELWSVSSNSDAVSLGVGDSDQDGNIEAIWGTGTLSTGKHTLVVFDAKNQVIDFQSTDPSQLDNRFTGGKTITNDDGTGKVVFAVATTGGGREGSRIISMDFETGEMSISPEVGSNWYEFFDFCVADYDLDGREEVLFSSSEFYDGFLSAYDPFEYVQEWSVEGDFGTAGDVTCGDTNGDGYIDLATIWGSSIRLYDPFNEVLLWDSMPFVYEPSQVELKDLDGDDIPEILVLNGSRLVVYSKSGDAYFEQTVYEDDANRMMEMHIEDIDGDYEPEIVISKYEEDDFLLTSDRIVILNKNLEEENSFTIEGDITDLAGAGNKDNTLFVATSSDPTFAPGNQNFVKLVDINAGSVLWKSPPLLGQVTGDSLHIVQQPGTDKKQLAIGTFDAMYITQ